MIGLALSVLAASVVGSLHCTSMCGGLIAFGTGGTEKSLTARAVAVASYNATRGLGYVALGTAAGALGSSLDHVGLRVGISRGAGLVASIVMIAWGLTRLLDAAKIRLFSKAASANVVPIGRLVRGLREKSPAFRSAVIGGCTALLPCGFLHSFLVVAGGTGSAGRGALIMGAFWLGTLPAVVGLGVGVGTVFFPLRRHAALIGALVLMGFGLSNLFARWSPPFSDRTRIDSHAR